MGIATVGILVGATVGLGKAIVGILVGETVGLGVATVGIAVGVTESLGEATTVEILVGATVGLLGRRISRHYVWSNGRVWLKKLCSGQGLNYG